MMVDICDIDLIGTKLEQNGLVVHLTKEYYQQEVIEQPYARQLLQKCDIANLVGKDGCKSQLEKAFGEKVTPENSFFHICGYAGTINAVISILSPLGFVTNRMKREDGSFDIKIETYI